MQGRKITFSTNEEAHAFVNFCNMKSLRIANKSNEGANTVVLFSVLTDDQWNDLIYKFGRWY